MGAILLVTIPAAAQEKRSFEVHVSGAAIYDSNAAGASKARAAARGLVQEEMEFRPSINASLVLPFDDHVFFLDTQAGYEFHSRNKRLESERIRQEERRVGKEGVSTCRYLWWTVHSKKKKNTKKK